MPTPTSPAPSRSEQDVLAEALTAFRDGEVRTSDVKGLSDLSRSGRQTLAAAWSTLPEAVRRRVTRQMGKLAEERVELNFGRALRIALDDDSPAVRQLAVGALWEDDGADLRVRFAAMAVADESLDVRSEALRGLDRFATQAAAGECDGDDAAALRSLLIGLARDPAQAPFVHRLALEALGAYGDADVAAMIDRASKSGDHDLQISAIVAMGRSMDAAWLPRLVEELGHGDVEAREAAARAIGLIGDPRAVGELARAGTDPSPAVRTTAIAALGQIAGPAAIKALRWLEADASDEDLATIEASLSEARGGVVPI